MHRVTYEFKHTHTPTHYLFIFIGADTSVFNPDGKTVYVETYEDKGKLVFDKHYNYQDLPGLWVAGL